VIFALLERKPSRHFASDTSVELSKLPSFLHKRETHSQFEQRIGQSRSAMELPNGLSVDSEELILHLRLASHLP
jgi:hypothetical protein